MKRSRFLFLLALMLFLPMICLAENTITSFSGTWPGELVQAVANTPLASARPLDGYVGIRDGQSSHAAAVAQDGNGYLLAVFTNNGQGWQASYSRQALRQDAAPQLWNQAISEEWSAKDIADYDGSEQFEVVYDDVRYTWQATEDDWQLTRALLPVANVVVTDQQLYWNEETVFNPQDTSLQGFVEADFPQTLSAAQVNAASSTEVDTSQGVTIGASSATDFPVTLYEAPTTGSAVVGYYAAGVSAQVLDQGSGFVKLEFGGSFSGWAEASHFSAGAAEDGTNQLVGSITTSSPLVGKYCSLLSAPSEDASSLALLGVQFQVRVLGITADGAYVHVQLSDGQTGFLPAASVSAGDIWITSDSRDNRVNLRASASTKSQTLGKYFGGVKAQRIYAVPADEDWMRVSIYGYTGWMMKSFLTEVEGTVPDMLPPLGVVDPINGDTLNLRAEPDQKSTALSQYPAGTVVEILGVNSNWAHIRLQDGCVGFMLLKYVGGEPVSALKNAFTLTEDLTLTDSFGNETVTLTAGTVVASADGRLCPSWRYDAASASMVFATSEQVELHAVDSWGYTLAENAPNMWEP
jgi:uncharacterized protein YgiM (DUF1202 family)